MSAMQRRILHLDMDAFYASVEALDNPRLKGKPLVVGGLGPRSVVCACSYEARKFGVHSAMPMRRARELCPKGILVKPRMERYQEVSEGIFSYLVEIVSLVEKTSIDEGYLDISQAVSTDAEALQLGKKIQQDIRDQFHLACSVGIAPCKFISKIASDLRKPNALVQVTDAEVAEFLAPLGVERIPGVGDVGQKKLHNIGIHTIGELRELGLDMLRSLFGKWGIRLHDFARGIDPRPVVVSSVRKSLGTETTFDEDISSLARLDAVLDEQATEIAEMLRRSRQLVRTITVKVRYGSFRLVTRRRTFPMALQSARDIASVARDLLRQTEAGRLSVRLVGVSVSSFVEEGQTGELPLFSSMDVEE